MTEMIQAMAITTVEALCCKIFAESFLKERYEKTKIINYLLLMAFVLVSAIMATLPVNSYFVKSIITIIIIMLFISIYFQAKVLQALFCAGGFYGILLSIDKITLWLLPILIPNKLEGILEDPFKIIILALLCKSLLLICVIFLNRKFKKKNSFQLISDIEWLKFLFFPMFTVIAITLMVVNNNQYEQIFIIISFGLIIGNFFVFYMLKDIVSRERKLQEVLIAQERAKLQKDMYYQIEEHYEKQKVQIHEFKNQLGCIQGLLELGEKERALSYITNINDLWVEEMDYIRTNHIIVNAVLNQQYKKAKAKGIPIVFVLNNMESLTMKEEDIVTLLSNLLNNAIEAVEKITSGDRVIKFKMIYENNQLQICVRNPILGTIKKEEGKFLTTKTEKENHGIGINNIESILHKYGGKSIYGAKKGYFTVTIIINKI